MKRRLFVLLALCSIATSSSFNAHALPSHARQTGLPCSGCHYALERKKKGHMSGLLNLHLVCSPQSTGEPETIRMIPRLCTLIRPANLRLSNAAKLQGIFWLVKTSLTICKVIRNLCRIANIEPGGAYNTSIGNTIPNTDALFVP